MPADLAYDDQGRPWEPHDIQRVRTATAAVATSVFGCSGACRYKGDAAT